eukprot:COSAG06_NODE_9441_length_1901_cov_11.315205_2_plen_129_part_00
MARRAGDGSLLAASARDTVRVMAWRAAHRDATEIDASAVSWRSTVACITKNRGGATCVGAWSNFIRPTLRSASFCIHLAKMDIHEDRWPRHLHLVHLVLPTTVHYDLLCWSRSQHRAGAPAPIAAPRC